MHFYIRRIDVTANFNQFSVCTFPGDIIPDLLAVVHFAGLYLGRKKAFPPENRLAGPCYLYCYS